MNQRQRSVVQEEVRSLLSDSPGEGDDEIVTILEEEEQDAVIASLAKSADSFAFSFRLALICLTGMGGLLSVLYCGAVSSGMALMILAGVLGFRLYSWRSCSSDLEVNGGGDPTSLLSCMPPSGMARTFLSFFVGDRSRTALSASCIPLMVVELIRWSYRGPEAHPLYSIPVFVAPVMFWLMLYAEHNFISSKWEVLQFQKQKYKCKTA